MSKSKPTKFLTQARHDPAHCLAPGLFSSFKRGERKGRNLDLTYKFNDDLSLRFTGYQPLGAEELRLLQGLLALAPKTKHTIMLSSPTGESAKQLVLLLEPTEDARGQSAAAVRTTIHRLMGEVGYKTDGGQTRKDVIESLNRLSGITTHVTTRDRRATSHLLSYQLHEQTGELLVALNPRLTQAILDTSGGYTHIDMREVRLIKSDATRVLHQRLSAIVKPGQAPRPFALDTLIAYVWPVAATGSTLRTRRQMILKALTELEGTGGWTAARDEGMITIGRRKLGYVMNDAEQAAFA